MPPPKKTTKSKASSKLKPKAPPNTSQGSYFQVDEKTGLFSGLANARPGNQSSASMQKKLAAYMKKKLTPGNTPFIVDKFLKEHAKKKKLSEMDGGEGIDIAHQESAEALKQFLAKVANKGETLTDQQKQDIEKKTNEFVDNFYTTGASDNDEIKQDYKTLINKKIKRKDRLKVADRLLRRTNRTRGNLRPGKSKINRHLGQKRDVFYGKDKKIVASADKRIKFFNKIRKTFQVDDTGFEEEFDTKKNPVSSSGYGK